MPRQRTIISEFGGQTKSPDDQILHANDDVERREDEESDEMVHRKGTTISHYRTRSKCAIPELEERRRKEGERNRNSHRKNENTCYKLDISLKMNDGEMIIKSGESEIKTKTAVGIGRFLT
jgi:hypothetical protein